MIDLSVYLVADLATIGGADPTAIVGAAVDGGATTVQVRGKHVGDDELLRVVTACAERIAGRATLLVNDRVEVFLAARDAGSVVHGVHLGQSDGDVAGVRERVGRDAIIGLSASSDAEIAAARRLPPGTIDYLGVGAVRATPTKPDAPDPLGWDGLAHAVRGAGPLPCVGIGGLGFGDAAEARAAGASGFAVVRAICSAPDPEAAARRLRDEWDTPRIPTVLAIAGSDPSGGAGIQADLKTIQATGGYGMAALTALTAQNTHGVRAVHVPEAAFLRQQLDALSSDVRLDAVKIGMLGNAEVIAVVAEWLRRLDPRPTIVLDPVMVATSGDRLLDAEGQRGLASLLDVADLVTPNLPELAAIEGGEVAATWDEALAQARRIARRHGTRVFAKGGHLPGEECPDALVGADGVVASFAGRRINTTNTHGTGCTLSSAMATIHARTGDWTWSARVARDWVRGAIAAASTLDVGRPGGNGPLDHGHALRQGARPPRRDADLDAWWHDIGELRSAIASDPFVTSLADGSLDRARFERYLAQDAIYLASYAALLGEAARLAPTREEQLHWAAAERSCRETELAMHRAHGADGTRAPSPETAAYLAHLRRAAATGDYGILLAAVLPCYWIYDDTGRALTRANHRAHPFRDWLDTYGSAEFSVATRDAIRLTQCAADAASDRRLSLMRRAFALSAEHERAFFAQVIEI